MGNKILICLLMGGIIFGGLSLAGAEKPSSGNRKEKKSTKSSYKPAGKSSASSRKKNKESVAKKTLKALEAEQKLAAASFDASKPSLTKEFVQNTILKYVFDEVVGKEIPEDMKNIRKASDTVTSLKVASTGFRLRVLISNREVEEVTRIPLAWYKKLAAHIDSLRSLASAMDNAVAVRNGAAFAKARAAFIARQEIVKKFMDAKPPRLSSKELQAIRKANTQYRKVKFREYQKKQMEDFLRGGKKTPLRKDVKKSSPAPVPGDGKKKI